MTQALLTFGYRTGKKRSTLTSSQTSCNKKREGSEPESQNVAIADQSLPSGNSASYLGHLDHVGKLCQTGDGDHVMIGFHLVPGEVIKHSKQCHGIQHFSEAM